MPIVKIMWPPILTEDRNKIADRVVKTVGRPIETVNEGRAEIGVEPLPDAKYDIIPDAPATGMGPNMAPSKNPEQSESTRTGAGEEMASKLDKGNSDADGPVR